MLSATATLGIIATIAFCPFGSTEPPVASSSSPKEARTELVHSEATSSTSKKVSIPYSHPEVAPHSQQDLGGGAPSYHLGTSDATGGIQMMMRD